MYQFKSFLFAGVLTITGFSNQAFALSNEIRQMMLVQDFSESIGLYSSEAELHDASIVINDLPVDNRCEAFVTPEGMLGEHGIYARDLVLEDARIRDLLTTAAINDICPNYPNLSENDRALMWTLVVTTMANFESSCNPRALNPKYLADGSRNPHGPPNGDAIGYFQLHRGSEGNYSSEGICEDGDGSDAMRSIRCVLGMITHQVNTENQLFTNSIPHFDVLWLRSPLTIRINGVRKRKAEWIRSSIQNSRACRVQTI